MPEPPGPTFERTPQTSRCLTAGARRSGPSSSRSASGSGSRPRAHSETERVPVGLVYIAAFGLDEGESVGALLQQGPPTPALANLDVDSERFARIPEDDFLGHFAADIDPVKAKVMYAVHQRLHWSTLDDVMGAPAWKSLSSWYLVAENDEVIPPDAERRFAQRMGADTIEIASGHCAMVSHPEETHERIVTAANAVAMPGYGRGLPSRGSLHRCAMRQWLARRGGPCDSREAAADALQLC
jgi:pimeloyl-ACP methyl ester carboxylesterase